MTTMPEKPRTQLPVATGVGTANEDARLTAILINDHWTLHLGTQIVGYPTPEAAIATLKTLADELLAKLTLDMIVMVVDEADAPVVDEQGEGWEDGDLVMVCPHCGAENGEVFEVEEIEIESPLQPYAHMLQGFATRLNAEVAAGAPTHHECGGCRRRVRFPDVAELSVEWQ